MIGIIGGYGAVGAQAARQLCARGAGPLRIGGRNAARAAELAARLPGPAEAASVDVADDASLAAFVAGCRVVVHCAGPSHHTAGRVARAALAAGAHHVDAGAPDELTPGGDRLTAVFAAGALPGLSGLLPRWLAVEEGFDSVHGLTAYAAVLDRFTAAGAEDYLHGVLGDANEPLAAWQGGERRAAALARRTGLRLPFLPHPVAAYPYLDAEGERLARELGLDHGRWYTVLDGERLPGALDAARVLDQAEAVAGLCRAAALDAAGRTPYAALFVQLDGAADGQALTRTAVLRAPGVAQLTGAVTAAATLGVLHGELPPGAHWADEVLDPGATVERLSEIIELTVTTGSIEECVEEGTL